MTQQRIEDAVQRIERALARIAHCADSPPAAPPSVTALVDRHETMRETVAGALRDLDRLIERIEQR